MADRHNYMGSSYESWVPGFFDSAQLSRDLGSLGIDAKDMKQRIIQARANREKGELMPSDFGYEPKEGMMDDYNFLKWILAEYMKQPPAKPNQKGTQVNSNIWEDPEVKGSASGPSTYMK